MTRAASAGAAILALLSLGASGTPFEDPVKARGRFEISQPYPYVYEDPFLHGPPFPVDAFLRESESPFLGYFQFSAPPSDPARDAGWIYANETGRVRVRADTINFHNPELAALGPLRNKYERALATVLHWTGTFTKEPGVTTRKFTVNKSSLTVFHPHWYDPLPGQPPADIPPTPDYLPYAALDLVIHLHRPQLPPNRPGKTREVFWTSLGLGRYERLAPDVEALCSKVVTLPHGVWFCESGSEWPLQPRKQVQVLDPAPWIIVETLPYTGTIDLSGLGDGEIYVIEYVLLAAAESYGAIENYTSAYLGDPLDPESGLSLDVSPPTSGKPPRLCDVEADEVRFTDNADGTVADAYTGLVWQRCPAGQAIDDAGTPGDMGDDRCLATSSVSPTWQGALQHAAADATAGSSDWRLPNVKELDSIVELGCRMPAIEPAPFPDTPPDPFWTSTPSREGAAAMAVSFATGSVDARDKTSQARVRLVRTGPLPPAPSLPGLRVGRPAPVLEPDAGTASMAFTVVLDRPAASEVTVRYQTADDSARAGEDYLAASGTLVIPAGARTAQVAVPILADGVGEPPEAMYLVLDQVSPNARLAVAASSGTILDSQPRVEVAEANVLEGDAGSADLAFLMTLSKPSAVDMVVSYATSYGTATSGDYTPASGTAIIPAGLTSALVHVGVAGDTAVEGDEYLVLTLTGVTPNAALGAASSARGYIVEDDLPGAQALNDTGIGQCTNGSVFTTCPQAGWPGQDAESGRDVTANVPGDGYRGFSFTKLDAAGVPLADQTQPYATAPWSCVRDEVTALVWEVNTNDGGLHDKDWTYTWYSSTGIDDGGSPGTPAGGVCAGAAGCDTEKLVAAVNAAGWCGAADWRLPGREELRSLVVAKDGGFLYLGDPPLFPNAPGSHWTSTPSIDPTRARYFIGPIPTEGLKSTPQAVRLVRGGS